MTLRVVIRDAYFLKNLDFMSNMDPYIVVFIGASRQRTPTCQQGGKHPRWQAALNFSATDSKMKIEAWDEDVVNDDFIGSAYIDLTKYYRSPGTTFNEAIQAEKYGKKAGTINLMIQYYGPSVQPGAMNPYLAQQQQAMQQQMMMQQQRQMTMYGNYNQQQYAVGNINNMMQQNQMQQQMPFQNRVPQAMSPMMSSNAGLYPNIGNTIDPSTAREARQRIQSIFGDGGNCQQPLVQPPPPLPPGINPNLLGMNLIQKFGMNDWDPNFSGR